MLYSSDSKSGLAEPCSKPFIEYAERCTPGDRTSIEFFMKGIVYPKNTIFTFQTRMTFFLQRKNLLVAFFLNTITMKGLELLSFKKRCKNQHKSLINVVNMTHAPYLKLLNPYYFFLLFNKESKILVV